LLKYKQAKHVIFGGKREKYTFPMIFFKNILNKYVLLLNFYYKHSKIIENINIDRRYGWFS